MARANRNRPAALPSPSGNGKSPVHAIVEKAVCPAVATASDNRVVAWNPSFAELAHHRQLAGENLQRVLRCRHPNGNLLSEAHAGIHETVLAGEAPAAFEVDVHPQGGARTRVEVSIVVVYNSHDDDHFLVYLMRPRHRRRRLDAALDRLLAGSDPPPVRKGPSLDLVLTRRQVQVLNLMADGATATEIADELGISANTVRTHIRSILETLGVTRQTEAVARAVRDRLI